MGIFGIVTLVILAVLIAYVIMLYNSLVAVKHNVSKAWANIDVQIGRASCRERVWNCV